MAIDISPHYSSYDDNHHDLTGRNTLTVMAIYVSILGGFASLILLLLVLDLKVWNDFVRMIFYMTLSQFVFDILISVFYFRFGVWLTSICFIGGVTSFIFSTMICFSVYHILRYKESFDVRKWWNVWALITVITNASFCILLYAGFYMDRPDLTQLGDDLVTWIRLLCLLINLAFYFGCKYIIQNMNRYYLDNNIPLSNSAIAMQVLVNRLKYYPLLQALARVPSAIYEFTYGFNFAFYDTSKFQFYFSVFCFNIALVAPIGFLVTYLKVQPNAYIQLKTRANQLLGGRLNKYFDDDNSAGASNINTTAAADTIIAGATRDTTNISSYDDRNDLTNPLFGYNTSSAVSNKSLMRTNNTDYSIDAYSEGSIRSPTNSSQLYGDGSHSSIVNGSQKSTFSSSSSYSNSSSSSSMFSSNNSIPNPNPSMHMNESVSSNMAAVVHMEQNRQSTTSNMRTSNDLNRNTYDHNDRRTYDYNRAWAVSRVTIGDRGTVSNLMVPTQSNLSSSNTSLPYANMTKNHLDLDNGIDDCSSQVETVAMSSPRQSSNLRTSSPRPSSSSSPLASILTLPHHSSTTPSSISLHQSNKAATKRSHQNYVPPENILQSIREEAIMNLNDESLLNLSLQNMAEVRAVVDDSA